MIYDKRSWLALDYPSTPGFDDMASPDHPDRVTRSKADDCRHCLAFTCGLALLWAAAVFAVQEYTTGSNYPLPLGKAVGSRVVRFCLDLLACGTVVFLARGWPLYLTLLINACGALVLIVYYEYFDRALTFTTIRHHLGEGLAVLGFAVDLIRWQSFTLIVLTVLLLGAVVRRAGRYSLSTRRRVIVAASCAVGYVILAAISTTKLDRIEKLQTFSTVDRIAMTNGYLLTWFGEWLYLDGDALLRKAMLAAQFKSDRITPLDGLVHLEEKVAIVQVESLDDSVIDFEIEHQAVMPFLRGLSKRAMRYRISAVHESGSCDADFVMLMNLYPIGDASPYVVPNFDFGPSLAAHARRSGYRSVFLHGNESSFFNRGAGIRNMGFDSVLFREELESQHRLTSSDWGVSDKDVFAVSSRLFNHDQQRAFHFIITLTTHGPYNFLKPEERELFPSATSQREHYLNSMRYVDTQLGSYIESLPKGTVVILYGDHTSHVDYGQAADPGACECVPFMIIKVGEDLAPLQRMRGQELATSGELTTLDAAGYVWSLFRSGKTQ